MYTPETKRDGQTDGWTDGQSNQSSFGAQKVKENVNARQYFILTVKIRCFCCGYLLLFFVNFLSSACCPCCSFQSCGHLLEKDGTPALLCFVYLCFWFLIIAFLFYNFTLPAVRQIFYIIDLVVRLHLRLDTHSDVTKINSRKDRIEDEYRQFLYLEPAAYAHYPCTNEMHRNAPNRSPDKSDHDIFYLFN